jgi:hypothetical protein
MTPTQRAAVEQAVEALRAFFGGDVPVTQHLSLDSALTELELALLEQPPDAQLRGH